MADLEGGMGPESAPPLFSQNLPSNVSKTQELRPKISEFLAISGDVPPLWERAPLFEISGSATA